MDFFPSPLLTGIQDKILHFEGDNDNEIANKIAQRLKLGEISLTQEALRKLCNS